MRARVIWRAVSFALFGPGAQSEHEYVWPYGFYRGGVDPFTSAERAVIFPAAASSLVTPGEEEG